nr:MAG TPA: outer membrane protein assembly factor [Caudoviricetes sp.]
MNIERKNGVKPNSSRTRGMHLSALALSLLICGLTLTGCATKPLPLSVNCPEPAPLPVHLKESCLPDAQACSREAQAWLNDVKKWLETAQQSTTQ